MVKNIFGMAPPLGGFGATPPRGGAFGGGKKECILVQSIDIRLYLDGLYYMSDKFKAKAMPFPGAQGDTAVSDRLTTGELMKALTNPKARKDLFVTFTQTVVCKEKKDNLGTEDVYDFCRQKGGTEEPYEKPKFDKKTGKVIGGKRHDVSRFSVAFKQYCRKCKVLGECGVEGKEQCKCTFKIEDPTIMGEFRHEDIMNLLRDLIIKDNANAWQRKMIPGGRLSGLGEGYGMGMVSPFDEAEVKKARKKLCDKITEKALAKCPQVNPALCCISGGKPSIQ